MNIACSRISLFALLNPVYLNTPQPALLCPYCPCTGTCCFYHIFASFWSIAMLFASIESIFACHSLLFLQDSRPSLSRRKKKGQSIFNFFFLYATHVFVSVVVLFIISSLALFLIYCEKKLDVAKEKRSLFMASCVIVDFIRMNTMYTGNSHFHVN